MAAAMLIFPSKDQFARRKGYAAVGDRHVASDDDEDDGVVVPDAGNAYQRRSVGGTAQRRPVALGAELTNVDAGVSRRAEERQASLAAAAAAAAEARAAAPVRAGSAMIFTDEDHTQPSVALQHESFQHSEFQASFDDNDVV